MIVWRSFHRIVPPIMAAAVVVGVLAGPALSVASGQLLQQLRDEVRLPSTSAEPATPSEPEKPRKKESSRGDCHDGGSYLHGSQDDDSGLVKGALALSLVAATSPFWIPRGVIGDDSLDAGYFARYPYRGDLDGYLMTDPSVAAAETPWLESDQYNWLLRVRAEYGHNFDDLSWLGGQVLLDTASRWGVDTEFNYRRENLRDGRLDQLWTGDCNLVYRFAQSPNVQMRTGAGINWLSDAADLDTGFNFTYSGDWFPRQPWVVSGEVDWGRLGRTALFHGRATVGVQYHRVEIYTGYDYYDVSHTVIGGLIGGVRFWY